MKYKTIDLFAGIGGIRRGFELTNRCENVLSAEIDDFACKTYTYLYKENPKNDVTSEQFKEKVEATNYDVLLGGFPCQAFSSAGKKEGFRDTTRGTLFFDVADIIDRTRPKAFLLENVEGLITHKKGSTFRTIIHTLVKELNYRVIGVTEDSHGNLVYNPRSFLLNSKNFGVPQNRPRVYIVGFNKEVYGSSTIYLPHNQLPQKRSRSIIFKDITEILEKNVSEKYYLSEGYLKTLIKHKDCQKAKGNGFGYQVVNSGNKSTPISNAILATGGSGKERNLIYDYKKEYVGIMAKYKKTPISSEGIRTMTPTEWGRLQGFIGYAFMDKNRKDHFEFPPELSDTQKYKQFGNSVTIPVIEEIANYVVDNLDWLNKQTNNKENMAAVTE